MSENSADRQRTNFLLINLALISACILVLVVAIGAYSLFAGRQIAPTSTPLDTLRPTLPQTQTPAPSFTPTITHTPFPTRPPTQTFTPTTTLTPSMTPTQTGLPTLTPAKAQALATAYVLAQWTQEDADYMARLMQDYPDTLPASARGEGNSAYYDAYVYSVVAFKEALLRFPDAPQAEQWRWDLAYDLARLGDPEAGEQYAELISDGLNRGEVGLDKLYAWLPAKEPRLELYMIELEPISGYIASYLIEIRGRGSAYIWLLQSPSTYRAYPILTHFDFVNSPEANWIVTDLDGNPQNGKELAIYFSNPQGEYQLEPPRVFSLARLPIEELPFLPQEAIFDVGVSFTNYWVVSQDAEGQNLLEFRSTVFPPCPVTIHRKYRWNGLYFAFVSTEYQPDPEAPVTSYCAIIGDHAADAWGPEAVIPLMGAWLPAWPPSLDEEGAPYPADAHDEWLYRLGVYYALLGDEGPAKTYFNEIIANPSTLNSRWVVPARAFLSTYQEPEDIYQACVEAMYCYPGDAIDYLIDNLPPSADPLHYLWDRGLNSSSSGYFDFDGDEESERWFTVRHRPREKPQFWILARYEEGVKALFVANVDVIPPELVHLDPAYVAEESLNLMPVTFLDGALAFSMQRLPDTQEPYLVGVKLRAEYPNRLMEGLDTAVSLLFAGVSPSLVQDQLLDLESYPGLICRNTWSCDPFYYFLGLSSELAGDERTAVEAYHRLWLDYSTSPYTTMARLKLFGEAYHTPTPTPTITPTGTGTAQPTSAFSPTPTITGTPPTATPTGSPTPTVSGTPPTPTPTLTPTTEGSAYPFETNTPEPSDTPYPAQ